MTGPASCTLMPHKSRRCMEGELTISSTVRWLSWAESAFGKAVKLPTAAAGAAGEFMPLRSFLRVTSISTRLPDLHKSKQRSQPTDPSYEGNCEISLTEPLLIDLCQ